MSFSYRTHGKRLLDLAIVVPALAVAAPVIGGTAVAIAATMGRPVFFFQTRPGLHAKPFVIAKFRTMTNERGPDGELLPDDQRMTRVGQFIRTTSLDELPQLWNVVKGDMSLVGPRPLLMRYLDRYSPEQARRHDVKPGITGWTQVKGRNALTWDAKFALDVWYVDHISLATDLRILAMTAVKVLQRGDISAEGHVTMPEFMGNADMQPSA